MMKVLRSSKIYFNINQIFLGKCVCLEGFVDMGDECVSPTLSIWGQCMLSFVEKNQKVSEEELEVISVGLSSIDSTKIVLGDAASAIESISFDGNDVFDVQSFIDDSLQSRVSCVYSCGDMA